MDYKAFLKTAAHVKPSPRQLAWYDTEFYAFIHFSINTYTDAEWGDGTESPALFNPAKLDADAWVSAIRASGAKGVVLTAKHHCGFCLWPSRYTDYSVKSAPWKDGKGDVVREVADACRRQGMKFGFYLSPWDRHEPCYGTDDYNDFYCNQLTELLTGYGDIFMVWLDGACGEGPNGKKQVYDFPRIHALVRKYQPNACIFYDKGPDVRWCGNEAGSTRYAEWAVVPGELVTYGAQTPVEPPAEGDLSHIYNADPELGSLANIQYAKSLTFAGAEVDMSIRKGWFWHEYEHPHSLERLYDTYLRTVGGNCCFHLNVPPNRDGEFAPEDVQRLRELGDRIHETFAVNLAENVPVSREDLSETQCVFSLELPRETKADIFVLQEDIAEGQRVENFQISVWSEAMQSWDTVYRGSTVGHKAICRLAYPAEGRRFRVTVTAARDRVLLRSLEMYAYGGAASMA